MKIAYDLGPAVRAIYTAGLWNFINESTVLSYVTDASGTPIYNSPNGVVTINGQNYFLFGLNPDRADELHLLQGLELKSDTHGVFDFDAVVSPFNPQGYHPDRE